MIPDDLITPREAARLVRAHLSTVHRWIQHGQLPGYRRGRHRYLVSRADVEGLLNRVQPVGVVATTAQEEREYQETMERLRRKGLKV